VTRLGARLAFATSLGMALHLARNLVSSADQELFIRRANERGFSEQGWAKSFYTFSYADFYDLRFMGFRKLRMLNEEWIQAAEGFPPSVDKNVEILSYVIDGGLAHKDNVEGAGIVNLIRPGELQRVTTGAGMRHSEFNASEHEPAHFLQFAIEPETLDLEPSYEQGKFSREERLGKLKLIASHDGREGSVTVHQDVSLYSALIEPGKSLEFELPRERYGWLQVVRGNLEMNGAGVSAGDGVAIFGGGRLELKVLPDPLETMCEILLFDLA
jgi:redox-sensitive bicupin YhaK (pirin superfamily)